MTDWHAMYRADPDRVYRFNGHAAKLTRGSKGPDDLVLCAYVPDGDWGGDWEPLSMHFVAFAVDFLYANEDGLYDPRRGFAGGEYFTDFIYTAVRQGYRAAIDKLNDEKRKKRVLR